MLYLPIGIPGSGKSTLVRSHFKKTEIVCPDEIRGWLTDDESDQKANKAVFDIVNIVVKQRLLRGLDVVVDATNLIPEFWPNDEGEGTTLIFMGASFSLCKLQNEERERVVPEHVLERMWSQYSTLQNEWLAGSFDYCKVQWSSDGFVR